MTGNPESENGLQSLLEGLEKIIEPLHQVRMEKRWQLLLSPSNQSRDEYKKAEIEYRKSLSDAKLFEEISIALRDPGIQDAHLRRWATLARIEIAPNLLPSENIEDLVTYQIAAEKSWQQMSPKIDGNPVGFNDIKRTLRTSSNAAECETAWRSFHEACLPVRDAMQELVKARNISARILGYQDYYRMFLELQEVDEARLFSSFGRYADLTEDEFRRSKASIDSVLSQKFEVDAVDLAPWHYGGISIVESPPVFGDPTSKVFQGKNLVELARKYFDGMGLPVDNLVEPEKLHLINERFTQPISLDFDRKGDIHILAEQGEGAFAAFQLIAELARALFASGISKDLPFILRVPAHNTLLEGVAMMLSRQIYDMEWQIEMFGLAGKTIRAIEKKLADERKFRMAFRTRWLMVMTHFERGMYRDPDQDQQQRWWDLVERFQLIRRPGKEPPDAADWAYNMDLVFKPIYIQNVLVGEWIGSILHQVLRDTLNLKDRQPFLELPEAGKWMQEKLFSIGATVSMNELMRNLTGSLPQPDRFINEFLK